ncbi:uncharacterized protein DUF1217 [Shimia isoporae]|uniref:Uncharacterized protein DUF1217 n=1 Tax=Shimia isoporae TaxID=647720 RepID=A0A4R1N4E1_9RHOB|nr:DUF1217 domain-containing protein [Shimia isoporae]TCL01455.1 uncharacterized protein DUF1217 [Shimia isoporae]
MYQPMVVGTGLTAWTLLKQTMDTQTAAFEKSPEIVSDVEYFAENIGNVETAEDLVSDYRLMKVALGAFSLDDDIHNKFFVQNILEQGVEADDALANRMADNRYVEITEAFGFGDLEVPNTKDPEFANQIIDAFNERQFEAAVGNMDQSLRLALNAERELAKIANDDVSENTMWYSILGSEPLRSVFETALGLPDSFGSLDIDRQVDELRKRTESFMGDSEIAQFSDPAAIEKLNQRYLLMAQIDTFQVQSSGQIALQLLQF